jgi:hypothetical protein
MRRRTLRQIALTKAKFPRSTTAEPSGLRLATSHPRARKWPSLVTIRLRARRGLESAERSRLFSRQPSRAVQNGCTFLNVYSTSDTLAIFTGQQLLLLRLDCACLLLCCLRARENTRVVR